MRTTAAATEAVSQVLGGRTGRSPSAADDSAGQPPSSTEVAVLV
ncbi:hypothetical protein [Streptomyces sp. NPDC012510]